MGGGGVCGARKDGPRSGSCAPTGMESGSQTRDTGGREGLGDNHVRDAQSSGETLGLRHQVFEHQH